MVRAGEQLVEVRTDGDSRYVGGTIGAPQPEHLHVERERPFGDGGTDGPEADDTERLSVEAPERCHVPFRRRLPNPGFGEALLEGEHGREHELGDRRSARALRAGHRPAGERVEREAVDTGPEDVDPSDPVGERSLDGDALVVQGHQHLGSVVGRVATRRDELRPGHRSAEPDQDRVTDLAAVDRDDRSFLWARLVHPASTSFSTPGVCTAASVSSRYPGASSVSTNHPVGHMVRISTKEKPAPARWVSKARSR